MFCVGNALQSSRRRIGIGWDHRVNTCRAGRIRYCTSLQEDQRTRQFHSCEERRFTHVANSSLPSSSHRTRTLLSDSLCTAHVPNTARRTAME